MTKLLLIVTAMQLPIIALLVIFSFRASFAYRTTKRRTKLINEENKIIEDLPFLLLEVAFFFNLLSILLQIFSKESDSETGSVLGSLTTAFFLLGALFHFIPNLNSRYFKIILAIFIISAIIFINSIKFQKELVNLPHWIDFFVFALTSYFLYKRVSIRESFLSNFYINYYVLGGFLVWTILQLWKPYGNLITSDTNLTDLIGYSVSDLGKGFILFGLYDFSIKRAEYYTKEVINQNRFLSNDTEKLKDLDKLVNEIAVLGENDGVITLMIEHLIYSTLFSYDYAIFSKADYIKGKIIHNKNNAKANNRSELKQVSEWVRAGGVPFEHHDIMSQAVSKKIAIHVKKDYVGGEKNDFSNPNSILDKNIYERFEHWKLDRLFIPVSNVDVFTTTTPKKNEQARAEVIGVLELGFNMETSYYKDEEINKNIQILSLYLNNIAQTYLGNLLNEEIKGIQTAIDRFERAGDHIEFIGNVLKECAQGLEVDKGEISFLTLDNKQLLENASVYGDIRIDELRRIREDNFKLPEDKRKKGIFNHVAETKIGYFSNDVEKDQFYIPGLSSVKSQLSVPLQYNETVLGIMSLYSSKKDFFNEKKKDFAQRFLNASSSTLLRLKLSFGVGNLVIPYSIYDKGAIYKATCERLSKYFGTNFIAIWEGKIGKETFSNVYTTDKSTLPTSDKWKSISDFAADIGEIKEPRIVKLTENEFALNKLEKYAFDLGFCSLIYIPIGKHKGKKRFITMLSKRPIENIFPEDKTFFSHIGNKFLLSMTFFDVYEFFDHLTKEKYKDKTEAILKKLMPMIQEISGADVLLIFIYNPHEGKFIQAIIEGALYDERLKERLISGDITENDFSYSVIINNSQWIENESQYIAYRNTQAEWNGWGVFEEEFWYREKIKSLAAIKIEFDDEILGVLFFNYREEQQFDISARENIKQSNAIENQKLINLLSNLIGRVIKISRTLEEDRELIVRKSKESNLIARSEVAIGMIHNIMNLGSNLSLRFGILERKINKLHLQNEEISSSLESMKDGITLFTNDYLIYKEYFASAEFKIEKLNVRIFFKDLDSILKYQIPSYQDVKIKIQEVNQTYDLFCDKIQLGHVILNLVKNSIEASASSISINFIETDSTNQYSLIEIQDNGTGIKEEDRARIFQPGVTTKKEGTGMGLPVSQDVLKNHGGRIDFHSLYQKNKSSGTRFSIYLPKKMKN